MAADQPSIPHIPKLALTRAECAQAIGVGTRKIDELIAGRRGNGFPVAHIGAKPIIPVADLERWLSKQAQTKRGSQ